MHDAVVPLENRLAKLAGEPSVRLDLGPGEVPVLTERGYDDQQVLVPWIACQRDQLADLAPELRHLRHRVGAHGSGDVANQRIQQGPFVADTASHRDRLTAQGGPALHAPLIPQRTGNSAEQCRA